MEWTRVSVQPNEEPFTSNMGLGGKKIGLDDRADDLHRAFIGSFSHLSEAREKHEELVSEIHPRGHDPSISTLGELLSELGGEWAGSEIRIPLHESSREEFVIETKEEEAVVLVRLISPERFGGMIKTFALPTGSSLSGVRWEGEFLTMRIEE